MFDKDVTSHCCIRPKPLQGLDLPMTTTVQRRPKSVHGRKNRAQLDVELSSFSDSFHDYFNDNDELRRRLKKWERSFLGCRISTHQFEPSPIFEFRPPLCFSLLLT